MGRRAIPVLRERTVRQRSVFILLKENASGGIASPGLERVSLPPSVPASPKPSDIPDPRSGRPRLPPSGKSAALRGSENRLMSFFPAPLSTGRTVGSRLRLHRGTIGGAHRPPGARQRGEAILRMIHGIFLFRKPGGPGLFSMRLFNDSYAIVGWNPVLK
jgi:hypothetical protein